MRLNRKLREGLIREARSYRRAVNGLSTDVADHITTILLNNPEKYGTEYIEAIEVSDYAYSIAHFVCPREDWL